MLPSSHLYRHAEDHAPQGEVDVEGEGDHGARHAAIYAACSGAFALCPCANMMA
jgi:hypothetical protein